MSEEGAKQRQGVNREYSTPPKKKRFLGRIERKRTTPTYEEHHRHEIRLRGPSLWRANPSSLHTHETWPKTKILTHPPHYCSILSFLEMQQKFRRLYLFYQSCKSFFTPFYWINGKKMTSPSHTNLATSTISESHICKPQKHKNGTSLSFSLSLTIFGVLRSYIASLESLLHFLTLSLNSVVVGLDTICNKVLWNNLIRKLWMGCLFDTKFSLADMPCMHAWIHARNWIKNMSPLKSHMNVPTMNNHSLRAVRVSITIF